MLRERPAGAVAQHDDPVNLKTDQSAEIRWPYGHRLPFACEPPNNHDGARGMAGPNNKAVARSSAHRMQHRDYYVVQEGQHRLTETER